MTDANARRLALEFEIVAAIVYEALHEGWKIDVNDGEEWTVKRSEDQAAILAALRTTEENGLHFVNQENEYRGMVRLIYGNVPWEVVNDYSVRLEEFMTRIHALEDNIEEACAQHDDAVADRRL